MLLALSIGTFSCGGGAGSSNSPNGENPGVPSVVQLRSSSNAAQTNATVYLHARILDGNGIPVKNERVTFTNLSEPFGVIKTVLRATGIRRPVGVLSAPVVKTNSLGIATVKLTSTTSGFATIQAEVNAGAGQVRDKRTIFFGDISGPVTSSVPTLALHVDDGNGTFDQNPDDFNLFKSGSATDNQRTIKAVVLGGSGVPLQGVTVAFGSDSPDEVTFTPSSTGVTNADGEAFVLVTVSPATLSNLQRVVNITAQATVGSTSLADVISLFLQPVTVSSVIVTANPDVVSPGLTSTIQAAVTMLGAQPVPDGSSVAFETTCGSITPFAQTTDGVATATFTAPTVLPPGPCTVTGTIGGQSGAATINVRTILRVLPSFLQVNGLTGGTATFTIDGGVPPFSVRTTDISFPAIHNAPNDRIFTVDVAPNSVPQSVFYAITDAEATSATGELQIGNAEALRVLPSAVIADSSAPEDTILFTIFGGVPPYFVFSNNPTLFPPSTPTVPSSGGQFTVVVPVDAPSGTVVLTVKDTFGTLTTANIAISAVAPQPLQVIPTARTIGNPAAGNTRNFTVLGGQAPYKAFSNNPILVTVPEDAAGNTVTATVASAPVTDTTVTITIFDFLGDSVTASLVLDVSPIIPPGSDTTAPLVLFTIPVDNATGVPVDADITIRFNEAMDAATISGATITMLEGALPFSPGGSCVTYDGATFTATIDISSAGCADLAATTVYTVTVSTNVRDVAGNQLAAPFTFNFTTGP